MGNEIVGSFRCVPLSFRPSIHLAIYPSAAEKARAGECEPPEAFRSALTGHHPASPKTVTQFQSPNPAERLTSLCQRAARRPTLRDCHTPDSRVSACVCIKPLSDTCNREETRALVFHGCILNQLSSCSWVFFFCLFLLLPLGVNKTSVGD